MLVEQLRNIVVTKEIHHRPFLFNACRGRRLLGLRLGVGLREIFFDAVNGVGSGRCRGQKRIVGAAECLSWKLIAKV